MPSNNNTLRSLPTHLLNEPAAHTLDLMRTRLVQNVNEVKAEGRYRYFVDLDRDNSIYPSAYCSHGSQKKKTSIFCSNDYLGMSRKPFVLDAMKHVLELTGAGSGGSRNISGSTIYHRQLEQELASLHGKDASLLFSSGYVANEETLSTLGKLLPSLVMFSDAQNHRSLIEGMRKSGCQKVVFTHNSLSDLRNKLAQFPIDTPKLIVFESVYSMDGDIAPIEGICDLAETYQAATYIDESHSVGVYGETGAGLAEHLDQKHRISIVQGGFGKAYGAMGGYIAADAFFIDSIRCNAPGFIFTTSLAPMVVAGVLASVKHLKASASEREALFHNVTILKAALRSHNLPVLPSTSHIIPVLIGNALVCRLVSERLMKQHQIYVQPINFPSVKKGEERLRLTPSTSHTKEEILHLVQAIEEALNYHRSQEGVVV